MSNPFTEHPNSVGESYWEHFAVAAGFGLTMLRGGLACLVHAVFPFWCTKTGSNTVFELHERMTRGQRGVNREEELASRAAKADELVSAQKQQA